MTGRLRSGGMALVAVLALATEAAAQAVEVAVVKSVETPVWRPALEAMRKAGRSHTFTDYDLRGDPAVAAQTVPGLRGRAAVLVALGGLAARAVRESLPDLPLVYCMVPDLARAGIPAAPHVTGVLFDVPPRNQLAAFRLVNPRAVRIGVLYNPESVGGLVEEAQKAASVLRLLVVTRPVAADRDVPAALRSLLNGPEAIDALWLPPDPMLLRDEARRFLMAEMAKAGKPVYSYSSALVPEGALASNGPDMESIGEEVGALVNRLSAGERNLPLRAPRAELVVNMRMASRLKIEIPEQALAAARKR